MNALKVIIYFSIFKYPLTKEEIYRFSSADNLQEIENELSELVQKKIIFKLGEFYADTNNLAIVQRRIKGNKMAEEIMPKALKRAKLIMSFPYVESVSISGSLAKNYYDDDGDIDFFIITKPQKLWLARTFLILFKKIFLLNSRKYFCVNYFISSSYLKIDEQNRFTATELTTLKPVYGKTVFNNFLAENQWAFNLYPNKSIDKTSLAVTFKKPIWSRVIEVIFNNKIGEKLDVIFKRITLNKWKSKFKNLRKKEFEVAMKSTNDVSKHHPKNFQTRVILSLNERCDDKNKAFNLNLTMEHA